MLRHKPEFLMSGRWPDCHGNQAQRKEEERKNTEQTDKKRSLRGNAPSFETTPPNEPDVNTS